MNWNSWLLWSFVATLALTSVMAGSQGLHLTRMNLPYMLGSIFTPNRERAKLIGWVFHLMTGCIFSLASGAALHAWGGAPGGAAAAIGLVQAIFVLTVVVGLLPSFHPRMASEHSGPTVTRQLEPPGFLALNYGYQTPISVVVAHLIYGAILGAFYTMR